MAENNNDPSQVKDTGHVWDGIRELDNPCPRWWLNSLWLSGLLVIVYFILYPSLPLITGSTKGILGWTQINQFEEDLAKVEAIRAPFDNQLAAMTIEEILQDQSMLNYAIGSSKVLFGDSCAACHGVGGAPPAGVFYPNLTDDDWLFGGGIYEIKMSIAQGRAAMMPAQKNFLTDEEVDQLVQFVIDYSTGAPTEAGLALYNVKGCVACHGADAKGITALGSANLTDSIWRFSGTEEGIRHTIVHGVNDPSDPKTHIAVMPGWNEKLAIMMEIRGYAIEDGDDPDAINWDDELDGDEDERLTELDIKKLTVYVHQLGGGQ